MRKAMCSVAAVLLVAAISVPIAAADKPVIEPLPAEDFVVPASVCGFDVLVEFLENKGKAITFSDGGTIITGALKVRLTNLADPTSSIVLNISGPGKFDASGALTATGPWLFFFLPGELGPGAPGMLAYVVGRVRLDESGFHQLAGTRTDLCPLLA
jgi:hypothetical protein